MPEAQTVPNPPSAQTLPVHTYVLGVDLAAQHDFTALCVLQASYLPPVRADRPPTTMEYAVVHLERWKDLPYPDTVNRILQRLTAVQGARRRRQTEPRLVVDATGVGLPVLHMLRERHSPAVGVMIHGGDTSSRAENNVYRVPKRDLVAHLQVTLQASRLKIARDLPLAHTLAEELRGFRVEISKSGHDRYGNDVGDSLWREQDHDDLVLATSLAVWWLEGNNRPNVFL